jgi:ferrochelatase
VDGYQALLLVSFGGPERAEDVKPFLRRVTTGRDVPESRLDKVAEHYYAAGGVSPLPAQCRALVEALRTELAGTSLEVYWGNRNWHPLLEDTLAQMRDDGIERALAFVTSAYGGYS